MIITSDCSSFCAPFARTTSWYVLLVFPMKHEKKYTFSSCHIGTLLFDISSLIDLQNTTFYTLIIFNSFNFNINTLFLDINNECFLLTRK